MTKIKEVKIGYLDKKAKDLDDLEYFETMQLNKITLKDIASMKSGKRSTEDIVKVTITVEKICG